MNSAAIMVGLNVFISSIKPCTIDIDIESNKVPLSVLRGGSQPFYVV